MNIKLKTSQLSCNHKNINYTTEKTLDLSAFVLDLAL